MSCGCEPNPCIDCPPLPVVLQPVCEEYQPCTELVNAQCILNTGGEIPEAQILAGDNLNTVIEKLTEYIRINVPLIP
jgi:hypothetical protein